MESGLSSLRVSGLGYSETNGPERESLLSEGLRIDLCLELSKPLRTFRQLRPPLTLIGSESGLER